MLNSRLRTLKAYFKNKHFVFYAPLIVLLSTVSLFLIFNLFYWGKIFPGVKIAGVDVGGLKPKEAELLLEVQVHSPNAIFLKSGDDEFKIELKKIDHTIDYNSTVLSAYHLYRTGNVLYDTVNRVRLYQNPVNLGVVNNINENALDEHVSVILGQIEIEPVDPSLELINNKVSVIKGTRGIKVNKKILLAEIGKSLSLLDAKAISVTTFPVGKSITEPMVSLYESMGKALIGKIINLEYDLYYRKLNDSELVNLLDLDDVVKGSEIAILLEEVKAEIERDPQNSVLTFEEGRVQEFIPSKDGVIVNESEFSEKISESIIDLIKTENQSIAINVPVSTVPPEIKTENVNNLGIKELLGRGVSRFSGSISSRIHNIGVASLSFNGVLVKPNETFSFNNTLGDVSAFTGYKQAYIIKDGKTMLGDGGGVCQVSTTLFRATLDAGLPITERRSHSYRVGYYEQGSSVGFDATVYAPTTDFKFKNDTQNHLLIQTIFLPEKSTLIFEIYGTNDGRAASISKPIVTEVSPPPEDLYIDDPTLPMGTIKQIDYKAWGAKASFSYTVERDGEIIFEKTFYSKYQPWQAKFLQGTAPVN